MALLQVVIKKAFLQRMSIRHDTKDDESWANLGEKDGFRFDHDELIRPCPRLSTRRL